MGQRIFMGLAALAVAIAPLGAVQAQSVDGTRASAAALREFDIMLMVTALRCRFGSDDFLNDYNQFAANHRATLQGANAEMLRDLVRTHGTGGATSELDRMSIGLANRYGNGHPWMDCAGLKTVAHELALSGNPDDVHHQAARLLGPEPATGLLLARRD